MARDNENGFWFIVAIAFAVVGLYFISKMAIIIGVAAIAIGVVLLLIALHTNEENLAIGSVVTIVAGIALLFIGMSATNFFEQNEIGKSVLDSSQTLVQAGADTANAIADVHKSIAEVEEQTNAAVKKSMEGLNK